MTVKGDLVRSKGERKIANALYEKGIEYRYEKAFSRRGNRVLPDFIIFHEGRMILWEHLGMLDIPEYATKWQRKKLFYESIGFREGENLIVTTDQKIDGLTIEKIMFQITGK